MLGLIIKDFYLTKKNLLTNLPGVLIFGISLPLVTILLHDGDFSIVIPLLQIIIYFFIFAIAENYFSTVFEGDENPKYCCFIISSPQTGTGQVLSKYIEALSITIFSSLICITGAFITKIFTDELPSLKFILIFAIGQLVIMSLEIPFTVKFSSKKGNYYKLILTLILAILFLTYVLYGDISFFKNAESLFDWFFKLVKNTEHYLLYTIFSIIAAAIFGISYILSVRIFRKNCLNYD